MTDKNTATSPEVLEYYARNWEAIANCYELGEDGLPIDVAWYRRKLYQEFLDARRPSQILDIGCGGGWTVLDALERGLDARGIEPVRALQQHGTTLLSSHGHDPDRIAQADLAVLADLPDESVDCIALLSVLSHVPQSDWQRVHGHIGRVLRKGGWFIAAYRNELFDFFTFNSFTVQFYDQVLWGTDAAAPLQASGALERLKTLVTNPDLPGPYHTESTDKSFGRMARKRANPLTTAEFLGPAGLRPVATSFYHFHCVPPLILGDEPNARSVNHAMELGLCRDWRGNFMAAMFVVEAVKP